MYAEKTLRDLQTVIYFARSYMQRKYVFEEFFFYYDDIFYARLETKFFILLSSRKINIERYRSCGSCATFVSQFLTSKKKKYFKYLYFYLSIFLFCNILYNYAFKIIWFYFQWNSMKYYNNKVTILIIHEKLNTYNTLLTKDSKTTLEWFGYNECNFKWFG